MQNGFGNIPMGMDLTSDAHLVEDVSRAIILEVQAYYFYQRLVELTPNEQFRQIIFSIQRDEMKHYHWFTMILRMMGGQQPQIPFVEIPRDFKEGVQKAIQNEVEAFSYYQDISSRAATHPVQMHFMHALQDEQRHATWLQNMLMMDNTEMIHSSSREIPKGLKVAENPAYPIGSKAIINADHLPNMKGAEATIVGAYDTTVYMVDYTSTAGEKVTNHKWLIESELSPKQDPPQPVDLRILQQRYPELFFLQGPNDQKRVALTFDDGPDPRFSNDVLDVLKQYNVPSTFFVLGSKAVANPEIVKRMQNEGHVIGNHTYTHPNLVKESDLGTLEREVTRTEDALNDIIGYRTKLFRPPYGFLYNELVEKLGEMNYYVIAWSVDSLDWQEDPPEVIASNVVDNIHPGAIILMHDGAESGGDRTNTIESLHQIIPKLQEQGYEFVTVPELLNIPFKK